MILVSGSLAYDYIMDFPGYFRDHILPEKLHVLSVSFLIDKMERNFGGTAGNIAYNLALLGERPTILASAGNDFAEYGRWLRGKGVELGTVRQVRDAPTAGAYIMTDKADSQITAFYPGAMLHGAWSMEHGAKLLKKKAKLAIVSPGNVEDMKALPRVYKKYGVPYVYDPGQNIVALSGRDLRNGINGAKVFISNDYELALVMKKTGWTKREMLKRVEALVTTLGERGSVIEVNPRAVILNGAKRSEESLTAHMRVRSFASLRMTSGRLVIPPAKPRNTSDPTGAGDAYRAGFIKGLLMGLPYDKVGKLASVVSVYTVEKYGTQTHRFGWSDIVKRYKANYKEALL